MGTQLVLKTTDEVEISPSRVETKWPRTELEMDQVRKRLQGRQSNREVEGKTQSV